MMCVCIHDRDSITESPDRRLDSHFTTISSCYLGLLPYSTIRPSQTRGTEADEFDTYREGSLGRPLRALRGDAHDRPRRHRGQRGAAVDPGRPRLLTIRLGLG